MQKSDATLKSVYDINSGNCNASLITTMTLDWSSSSSFEHTIISAMPEVIRIMILDKKNSSQQTVVVVHFEDRLLPTQDIFRFA